MRFRTRALMFAWAPYSGRTEGLAQQLGIPHHFVHYLAFQRPWVAPIKYPAQASSTLRVLWRERPAVVLVQNPPPLAALVAALYASASGGGFVMDSHSQAFFVRRWRWSLPLQRWLARRALTTIVTNRHLGEIVGGWGAPWLMAGDPPIAVPPLPPRTPADRFSVVCIATYGEDEPIGELLAAARQLPEIGFALTGNPKYARPEWRRDAPPNVKFTGFLPIGEYYRRIWNAHALVVLTTHDHTVLRGAWEAVALGQPLVTSDWPILREYFSQGTVYTDNTAAGMEAAIAAARASEPALRAEMLVLRDERRRGWQTAQAALEGLIDGVWTPARVVGATRPADARPEPSASAGASADAR